jgi:hypothetical protein
MLILWEKNQQETEFTCVTKRTRYVLVWLTVPAPLVAHIVVLLLQTLWKIMNEGQDYDYYKRNISVVICDTNIHNG